MFVVTLKIIEMCLSSLEPYIYNIPFRLFPCTFVHGEVSIWRKSVNSRSYLLKVLVDEKFETKLTPQ